MEENQKKTEEEKNGEEMILKFLLGRKQRKKIDNFRWSDKWWFQMAADMQEYLEKIKNEIKNINDIRWLACTNDNAIKRIIPLMYAQWDESYDEFQSRLKEAFIISWGKNTSIGKLIYTRKRELQCQSYSEKRKVNQDGFRDHIDRINHSLDKEL